MVEDQPAQPTRHINNECQVCLAPPGLQCIDTFRGTQRTKPHNLDVAPEHIGRKRHIKRRPATGGGGGGGGSVVITQSTIRGGVVAATPPPPAGPPPPTPGQLPSFEDTCYKLTGWTWAECREDHIKWSRVNPDVRAHLFALWSMLVKQKVKELPPSGPVVYCQPELDPYD